MNSIIVELYELSDAMSFMEQCLDSMMTKENRQLAGNAYIIGLFGRRLAEIAELLEREPNSDSGSSARGKSAPAKGEEFQNA